MGWPPKVGDFLPQAERAFGVREKLVDYSLNQAHEDGGPKARGFEAILGIRIEDVEYLEGAILNGVKGRPIDEVRDNAPYGINCVIDVPVRGLGEREGRSVDVRTVWEVTVHQAPPRLVSAYLKP